MDTPPRSTDGDGPRRKRRRGPFAVPLTRRAALAAAAGAGVGAGLERVLGGGSPPREAAARGPGTVPFHGEHQAGIATPAQDHLQFVAFDLTTRSAARLRELLERWTEAAAALTAGRAFQPAPQAAGAAPSDPGEAVGLPPARLTLTFGFGPGLFAGPQAPPALRRHRPAVLKPLPPFAGDELDPAASGGDLCVQACADDPQVAFHAVHVLSMLAAPGAALRWSQGGFRRPVGGGPALPRNLIGFIDGINNLRAEDPAALERYVWVQAGDGPAWMAGGSYLVARRIEIQFSSWDGLSLASQEQTIGRHKRSGARLAVLPPHAHIRQAAPAAGSAERILRRGFNYASSAERLADAGGGGELRGGLFFIAFARDPVRQFIPLQRRLAARDALSAFTLHRASAIFACPPGVRPGGFLGEGLFA